MEPMATTGEHHPVGPADASASGPPSLIAGRYRIERRIARGGQASVYLAHQEPLGRMIALKVLATPTDISAAERDRFQQRFLLEAKTLASLDHPHIVTVYDYGQTDAGDLYIAMEYVDGVRFNDLLRHGRLEVDRALGLVRQVCSALQYAHNRGVIHRDIKNSNVLVKRDAAGREMVKVVDFGIVKLRHEKIDLTQVGIILGSPHFMAPEQAQGKDVDHRVDIYAVGVLMYCALAGRYPFNGSHSTAILTAHLTREPPTFSEVAPDLRLPAGLEQLVRRCLAKPPEDRFPDMASIITRIDTYTTAQAAGPLEELGTMSREAVQKPSSFRSPLLAMTAGAFATLLVVSIGAITLALVALFLQSPTGQTFTGSSQVGSNAPAVAPPTAGGEDPVVNTTTRKRDEGEDPAEGAEVIGANAAAASPTPASSKSSSAPASSTSSSPPAETHSSTRPATQQGSGTASSRTDSNTAASSAKGQSGAQQGTSTGANTSSGTASPPQSSQKDPPPADDKGSGEGSMGSGSDLLDPWAN